MARFGGKKLWVALIIIVIVVFDGGYFAKGVIRGDTGNQPDSTVVADSTADSTSVGADTTAAGDKDKDGEDKDKEPDPVPVEVSTVLPREISSYYYTTATLDPEREVNVLSKIAGEIVKLHVEEGAWVSQGAVLCQIEDDEPRIDFGRGEDQPRKTGERIREDSVHVRGEADQRPGVYGREIPG